MEAPLTPLDFARRARRVYPHREAVVDGSLRLTYTQLFDRCDRWSAALQNLGVAAGDRVAYIAQNTHAHLEGYYAVPRIGAVIVPINYRLNADDFRYIIEHSGATTVCAQREYQEAVDGVRARLPGVKRFVALDGSRAGWLSYEEHLAHFKVPREVRFLSELPKTATGKVQKYVLRGSRPNLSAQ
jgi:fatty-acyl-CoA synthase